MVPSYQSHTFSATYEPVRFRADARTKQRRRHLPVNKPANLLRPEWIQAHTLDSLRRDCPAIFSVAILAARDC